MKNILYVLMLFAILLQGCSDDVEHEIIDSNSHNDESLHINTKKTMSGKLITSPIVNYPDDTNADPSDDFDAVRPGPGQTYNELGYEFGISFKHGTNVIAPNVYVREIGATKHDNNTYRTFPLANPVIFKGTAPINDMNWYLDNTHSGDGLSAWAFYPHGHANDLEILPEYCDHNCNVSDDYEYSIYVSLAEFALTNWNDYHTFKNRIVLEMERNNSGDGLGHDAVQFFNTNQGGFYGNVKKVITLAGYEHYNAIKSNYYQDIYEYNPEWIQPITEAGDFEYYSASHLPGTMNFVFQTSNQEYNLMSEPGYNVSGFQGVGMAQHFNYVFSYKLGNGNWTDVPTGNTPEFTLSLLPNPGNPVEETIRVKVTAEDFFGEQQISEIITIPWIETPTLVTGNSSLNLTWQELEGADVYKIYRKRPNQEEYSLATTIGNTAITNWTDPTEAQYNYNLHGKLNFEYVKYKMTAVYNGVESDFSNIKSARVWNGEGGEVGF